MLLFNLLSVVFFRAFLIAACPETFVVRNVNWDNTPSDVWLQDININQINGMRVWVSKWTNFTVVLKFLEKYSKIEGELIGGRWDSYVLW